MPRVLAAVVLCLALAGCGRGDDHRAVGDVVARFYDAIRAARGEEACAELSAAAVDQLESQSGRACAEAITRLDYSGGEIVATQVFVVNGKVDLDSGESAFLSRQDGGWKLSAIACTPSRKPADRPFDCEVEA